MWLKYVTRIVATVGLNINLPVSFCHTDEISEDGESGEWRERDPVPHHNR